MTHRLGFFLGILILPLLASAQQVRSGLWSLEILSGDQSVARDETQVPRELLESARQRGMRLDRFGNMTHMCWATHALGDGDSESLVALGPGATIEYLNVTETSYEDVTTSNSVRMHSRWRWVTDDCGDLVAWHPGANTTAAHKGELQAAARPAEPPASEEVRRAEIRLGWDAYNQKNYETAERIWRKHAVAGDAKAQFYLGHLYRLGHGVPSDPVLSLSWMHRAAESGHSGALNSIGVAYDEGIGVRKNPVEARRWYHKAASAGDRNAHLNLGISFEEGKGGPKDWQQAAIHYRRAAQLGDQSAQRYLQELEVKAAAEENSQESSGGGTSGSGLFEALLQGALQGAVEAYGGAGRQRLIPSGSLPPIVVREQPTYTPPAADNARRAAVEATPGAQFSERNCGVLQRITVACA